MITILLVCGVAAALLVASELARRDRRDRDAGERARLEQLHAAHELERREWTRERQMLLNRIKPETAQYVASDAPLVAPPAVGLDDDDAYWDATSEFSKDELAVAAYRAEMRERTADVAA